MLVTGDAKVLAKRKNKVVVKDGNRVVKIFKESKPAADVFNEALNLARVEEAYAKCPHVLEVARIEEGEHAGAWSLSTDYIEGSDLESLLTSDEGKKCALELLVKTQTELHSISAPLLNQMRDKLSRQIKSCDALDDAVRYDLLMRTDGISSSSRICHGDLVLSNVIVSEGEVVAVCDWAHVSAGNPAVDAACTYLQLSLEHPELKDDYLELYSEASGIPKQLIHYWLPVVAAAELSRGRGMYTDALRELIQVGDFQ